MQLILPCSPGVVVGVVGLGEEMPSTVTLSAARLLAWAMILLGVSALASGQGKPHVVFLVGLCSLCSTGRSVVGHGVSLPPGARGC